jgi:hypothetical protein
MSRPLRHIALTVERTGSGGYGWLLIESAGGRVFVLKKAPRTHPTYMGALDAGYQELALLSACGLHENRLPQAQSDVREPLPGIEMAETDDAL